MYCFTRLTTGLEVPTGELLNKIKSDPTIIEFQNKIIALYKADARFRKIDFKIKGKDILEFGGKRWHDSKEDWGALNSNNPAFHLKTWQVAGNSLSWSVRHATVEYIATIKTDGTAVISYHLRDTFDLTPGGRSNAYNNITAITGFGYHDVLGGNRNLQLNADWQIQIE